MTDKLKTLRSLPEDQAQLIFDRYMREQWNEGFQAGTTTMAKTQEIVLNSLKPKSIADLQKEAMNDGASNLPAGFQE